jgi:radical SAM protein with 4Fe4S-binding SPASM domain
MESIYSLIKSKYPETSFGIQTNLVYKLTEEKLNFFNKIFLKEGIGTSWDSDIRFENINQLLLWEKNVKQLISEGHKISLMVSLSKSLIKNYQPVDIVQYASDLGIQHILFERITSNGNAVINPEIQPSNADLDSWLLLMYEQTIKYSLHEKIHNMFLDEVATSFVNRLHTANRCRNCEQSLVTINADGTISGCPNSAPEEYWGNVDWSISENLNSKKRLHTMSCELKRNDNCLTCPVNSICNGDCHRLPWEGNICAAPKSLMLKMKTENKIEDYQKLLW